jgi:hypothetical protein
MGILDRVREAKERFKQHSKDEARWDALDARRALDNARAEREQLAARASVRNELSAERKQIRELKYPVASKVLGKIGEFAQKAPSLAQTAATKARSNAQKRTANPYGVKTNPFGTQEQRLGNSPFNPSNLGMGLASTAKKQPANKTSRRVVINIR